MLANASPSAIVTDVEHVGAKFNGQASFSTTAFKVQVAFLFMVESIFPVIAMLLMPFLLAYFKSLTNSSVSPLFEMQIKRSSLLNIPRSPWKASEV